jgi:hypothetical protein
MTLDPKSIHDLDQQTGPLGEFAVILAAYHRSLIQEGFTRDEAMAVILNYQESIILSLTGNNDGR